MHNGVNMKPTKVKRPGDLFYNNNNESLNYYFIIKSTDFILFWI